MAIQVMPLPASDEVTVTIRNEENPKDEKPAETRTLQQNIFLGILFMIVLIGALCLFIVAVEYINEGFIRLLAQRLAGDVVTAADAEATNNVEADEQAPEEVSVSRLTKRRREEELPEEKHRDLAQIMRSYVKQHDLATLKPSPK
ncbi:hypothetical protein JG687_00017461 [Phytophthora cactorum]|uniref:Uncharacterized protein n=1 Tax=Phytophthora cactorum TaxID=29920 RepID=A0A8T1TT67_9STRA|nr:hypothetical protein JG687_00017461 [Phytophthora cactorum]